MPDPNRKDSNREDRLDDLQSALALYAEHVDSSDAEIDALLNEHPGLRALLEPMFRPLDPSTEVLSSPGDRGIGEADRMLGDYRLLRELGRGGMGVVYEATELTLDRRVALKVLAPDRVEDAASIVRFQREAAAAASLEHPGLVKVLTAGGVGRSHFIAMEFVTGAPLHDVVDGLQRLPDFPGSDEIARTLVRECAHRPDGEPAAAEEGQRGGVTAARSYIAWAVDIVAQVAEALEHAHQRGVVHRDVKPANILVRLDDTAVLTDFGVARRAETPALTRTGDAPGTAFYMAPEQVQSWRHQPDHRVDIFALGVTLYELLTRQRPFRGATSQQVLDNIVRSDPVDPPRLNKQLPADLSAVVMMALNKDPADRYATAADLAADLRAFLSYRTVRARLPSVAWRFRRWARRRPVVATLLGLLLVAVPVITAVAGYWAAIQPALAAGEESLEQERVDRELTAGYLAMKWQDPATARRHFDRVLAVAPQNVEAVAGLVLQSLSVDPSPERARARGVLRRFDGLASRTPALQRMYGLILRYGGESEKADAIDRELGRVRGALDAFVVASTQLVIGHSGQDGAFEKALRLMDYAVATAERPRAIYDFARAHAVGHLEDPRHAEAAKQIAEVIDDRWPKTLASLYWRSYAIGQFFPERAAAIMREVLVEDPDSGWLWASLGYYLQRAGDAVGASAAYGKAHGLEPENPRTLHDLGLVKLRSGDFQGAIETSQRWTRLAPQDPNAWGRLAYAYMSENKLEQALRACAESLKFDPEHWEAYQVRGRVAAIRGDWRAAARNLRRSSSSQANNETSFHLGIAMHKLGKRSESMAAYREALRLDPRNAQAHNNLGNQLFRARDHVAAAVHLRKAIELLPSLSQPRVILFTILNNHHTSTDLEEHCAAWRREIPEDPYAYSKSAWFTLWCKPGTRKENANAALAWAERAVQLDPKNPRLAHILGVVQQHAGLTDLAIQTLSKGLEAAIAQSLPVRGVQDVLRKALAEAKKVGEKR